MESMTSTESRLPGISENETSTRQTVTKLEAGTGNQTAGVMTLGVQTPTTPRIDISRASSSSVHSRDSSPENVFEQVRSEFYVTFFFAHIFFFVKIKSWFNHFIDFIFVASTQTYRRIYSV